MLFVQMAGALHLQNDTTGYNPLHISTLLHQFIKAHCLHSELRVKHQQISSLKQLRNLAEQFLLGKINYGLILLL